MQTLKTQLISLTIVSSLLVNSLAFATDPARECGPAAITLNPGDRMRPDDCQRTCVATDVMQTIDKQLVEADYNKKVIDEQEKVIKLKDLRISESDQQADLWKAETQRERDALDKERSRNDVKFWVGLGLGALTILGGAWAVKQVGK